MATVKELVIEINSGIENLQNYKKFVEDKNYSFYTFAVDELKLYNQKIADLEEDNLCEVLQKADSIMGNCSKSRMQSLIEHITEKVVDILNFCYKGDLLNASEHLNSLFSNKKNKLNRYINDIYINFFKFKVSDGHTFFRVRDFAENEAIDNCYHIPFDKRRYASNGRYSFSGYPCLYLADNLNCACAEVGKVPEKKKRYYSTYKFHNNKPVFLLDLSLKNEEEINRFDFYDLFSSLITYPLILLCIIKRKHKDGNAHEEFFIPQLICHNLLFSNKDLYSNYLGIAYTSTKDYKSKCLAIPAIYKSKGIKLSGYCNEILSLFDISQPLELIQ